MNQFTWCCCSHSSSKLESVSFSIDTAFTGFIVCSNFNSKLSFDEFLYVVLVLMCHSLMIQLKHQIIRKRIHFLSLGFCPECCLEQSSFKFSVPNHHNSPIDFEMTRGGSRNKATIFILVMCSSYWEQISRNVWNIPNVQQFLLMPSSF